MSSISLSVKDLEKLLAEQKIDFTSYMERFKHEGEASGKFLWDLALEKQYKEILSTVCAKHFPDLSDAQLNYLIEALYDKLVKWLAKFLETDLDHAKEVTPTKLQEILVQAGITELEFDPVQRQWFNPKNN